MTTTLYALSQQLRRIERLGGRVHLDIQEARLQLQALLVDRYDGRPHPGQREVIRQCRDIATAYADQLDPAA